MDEILTPMQVAELLKIHVKTVYKLAKDGTLSGSRIGRSWRFSKSQLMESLSSTDGVVKANSGVAAEPTRASSE